MESVAIDLQRLLYIDAKYDEPYRVGQKLWAPNGVRRLMLPGMPGSLALGYAYQGGGINRLINTYLNRKLITHLGN